MPLATRDDCKVKAKVFAELKKSYGQKRPWTVDLLTFKAPKDDWLETARPPYTVEFHLANPSDATGTVRIVGTAAIRFSQ